MKGHIISFDTDSNAGFISGHDGNRYQFTRSDWRSDTEPEPQQRVDFEIDGKQAKDIVALSKSVKKNGAAEQKDWGLIASWGFGILFLLAGIGSLVTPDSALSGLFQLALAGILLPPVLQIIHEKTGRTFRKSERAIAIVVLLLLAGVSAPKTAATETSAHSVPEATAINNNTAAENTEKVAAAEEKKDKTNAELDKLAELCPDDSYDLLPFTLESPDSYYNLIRNKSSSLSELQRKDHFKKIEGQAVVWVGWIEEVKEKFLGGYEVWIDMDSPEEVASIQEVYFNTDKETAYGLNKDHVACFVGTIESVTTVFTKLQVHLENVHVIKTYE